MKCLWNLQSKNEEPKDDLRSMWVQGLLGSIQTQRIRPENVIMEGQFTGDGSFKDTKGIGAPKNSHWIKPL